MPYTAFKVGTFAAFYSLMAFVAMLLSFWQGHLLWWWKGATLFTDLLIGLGVGSILVLLSRWLVLFDGPRQVMRTFAQLFHGLELHKVVLLAVCSGVGEEALFRGFLQPEIGLIAATILFAALHIGPGRQFLWWTFFAGFAGCLFGGLLQWRESLVAPVVAHFWVNLLNIRYLSRFTHPDTDSASLPLTVRDETATE